MYGQQNDKYTEMHSQQNDKYTEMYGKQNDKISEMFVRPVLVLKQSPCTINCICFAFIVVRRGSSGHERVLEGSTHRKRELENAVIEVSSPAVS